MELYKLTDDKDRTREKKGWSKTRKWGMGVTQKAKGRDFIRAHSHPLLAVLSYLIRREGDFANIHLWLANGEPVSKSTLRNEKVGDILDEAFGIVKCRELTTLRQIDVPWVSSEELVAFAILCALEVYDEPLFAIWANAWLDGEDRTETAAKTAHDTAQAIANAALDAANAAPTNAGNSLAKNHAASAASSAAWSALTLEYKDNFTARPDSVGAFGAAFASQHSAYSAVDAARWAVLAKHLAGAEPIDILALLDSIIE
jgi:hypothetical protein